MGICLMAEHGLIDSAAGGATPAAIAEAGESSVFHPHFGRARMKIWNGRGVVSQAFNISISVARRCPSVGDV